MSIINLFPKNNSTGVKIFKGGKIYDEPCFIFRFPMVNEGFSFKGADEFPENKNIELCLSIPCLVMRGSPLIGAKEIGLNILLQIGEHYPIMNLVNMTKQLYLMHEDPEIDLVIFRLAGFLAKAHDLDDTIISKTYSEIDFKGLPILELLKGFHENLAKVTLSELL